MRRTTRAGALVAVLLLGTLSGCATPRPGSPGAQAITADPPLPAVTETAGPTAVSPAPAPAPTAASPAALTGSETPDQLFDHVAAKITVEGTDFHQIRSTPATGRFPATVVYATAQWDAHIADNSQPMGPIIVVRTSDQPREEVVAASGTLSAAARSASVDPLTPIEPTADSPSGKEQRLVVLPAAAGEGALVIATTGVTDADARAFAEAVTR